MGAIVRHVVANLGIGMIEPKVGLCGCGRVPFAFQNLLAARCQNNGSNQGNENAHFHGPKVVNKRFAVIEKRTAQGQQPKDEKHVGLGIIDKP